MPNNEVWTFGSPATHTEKPYSNHNLAIISDNGLSLSILAAIEYDFSESDLPFKGDVMNSATISDLFREIIEAHGVRIK